MASKSSTVPSTVGPEWEAFNIERHILVGRVEPSADGTVGPVEAAFSQIGRYMQENDDSEGYDVSFEIFGRSFRAQLEPDDQFIQRQEKRWPDDHDDF